MDSDVVQKLRLSIELFETGRDLMLQNLRRRYPTENEAQINERLAQWLLGAEGAYPGRPYSFRYIEP